MDAADILRYNLALANQLYELAATPIWTRRNAALARIRADSRKAPPGPRPTISMMRRSLRAWRRAERLLEPIRADYARAVARAKRAYRAAVRKQREAGDGASAAGSRGL